MVDVHWTLSSVVDVLFYSCPVGWMSGVVDVYVVDVVQSQNTTKLITNKNAMMQKLTLHSSWFALISCSLVQPRSSRLPSLSED